MTGGFANAYGVELLFPALPAVSKPHVLDALRRRCGRVDPLDGNPQGDMLAFVHLEHPVQYRDGAMPAQLFVTGSATAPDPQKLEPSLQQSWDWPDAGAAVQRAGATLLVTDLMAAGLDPRTRLRLFQQSLLAVLEAVPEPLAIHWIPAQRLLTAPMLYQSKQPDAYDEIHPAVNVRFFNVSDRRPGEMLMDTVGLAALGLPDLQCHFLNLDPSEVARVLLNTAYYVFQNGDVIGDGHTIQGLTPAQKWRCQHEDALVPPERVVLDVNPGPPHAAGTRR
jgi:hypothetical protein